MTVISLHAALAILLFYIVNWIGEHATSYGYLQLSLFVKADEAPAFNFFLKTIAPTVYVILIATAIYAVSLDNFLARIWLIAPYYFAFRLLYNLALGRARLLSWFSQVIQLAVGSSTAYLSYRYVILPRKPLFPDAEKIGNQLWVIIALFLYAVFNNVRTSTAAAAKRKKSYISASYHSLAGRYEAAVKKEFPEKYMQLVTFAVLVYENFNRPWLARMLERVVFPWGSKSLGPMQVHTASRITDDESVRLGVAALRQCFDTTKQELVGKRAARYQLIRMTLAKYNRDEQYINGVWEVLHILWAQVATEYRTEFETLFSLATDVSVSS